MTPNQSLIGESALMLDLTDHISKAAALDRPVLILGERGTGKELVAARLHYLSPRWDQSFISINCATISESLLESELFGHEAGAYTGAVKRRMGRFERADGGSLFLDELGTCSASVQEKLLRVIEYGEYERLGGQTPLHSDARLIAATNADLKGLADQGLFRADLLDRLAFDVIHVPPLRYRGQDIELLANHYAHKMCIELGLDYFPGFTEYAIEQLNRHAWPGNVRELKNVVERSVYQAVPFDEPIAHLSLDPFTPPWQQQKTEGLHLKANDETIDTAPTLEPDSLSERIEKLEKDAIINALQHHYWNQKITAQSLNLSYHQLRGLLRKHQMLPLKQYKIQQKL